MLNKRFSLEFIYDKMGYGDLHFLKDGQSKRIWPCRSGSINNYGNLVNFLPIHDWFICSPPETPVDSEADRMWVKPLVGEDINRIPWKWRMWPHPVHRDHDKISHYLLHPDGSKNNDHDGNGTKGCIGLKSNGLLLRRIAIIIFNLEPDTVLKVSVKEK